MTLWHGSSGIYCHPADHCLCARCIHWKNRVTFREKHYDWEKGQGPRERGTETQREGCSVPATYLIRQWAAVSTHCSLTSTPPQWS